MTGMCGLHAHLVKQANVDAVAGAGFVKTVAVLVQEMACVCCVGIG
jgi:hypothetical protein